MQYCANPCQLASELAKTLFKCCQGLAVRKKLLKLIIKRRENKAT